MANLPKIEKKPSDLKPRKIFRSLASVVAGIAASLGVTLGLSGPSNAQAAQLKSYCGLTIARWNDFAIPTLKVARSLTEPKTQRGLPLRARL